MQRMYLFYKCLLFSYVSVSAQIQQQPLHAIKVKMSHYKAINVKMSYPNKSVDLPVPGNSGLCTMKCFTDPDCQASYIDNEGKCSLIPNLQDGTVSQSSIKLYVLVTGMFCFTYLTNKLFRYFTRQLSGLVVQMLACSTGAPLEVQGLIPGWAIYVYFLSEKIQLH